jgi:hypothetical protein
VEPQTIYCQVVLFRASDKEGVLREWGKGDEGMESRGEGGSIDE